MRSASSFASAAARRGRRRLRARSAAGAAMRGFASAALARRARRLRSRADRCAGAVLGRVARGSIAIVERAERVEHPRGGERGGCARASSQRRRADRVTAEAGDEAHRRRGRGSRRFTSASVRGVATAKRVALRGEVGAQRVRDSSGSRRLPAPARSDRSGTALASSTGAAPASSAKLPRDQPRQSSSRRRTCCFSAS